MATAVATSVTLQRRLFTVAEYARLLTAGILSEDDRVELIDGEVRVMSPIGPLHAAMVDRLTRLLVLLCAQAAIVRVQSSIQLNDYTEPQPDFAVLQPRDDFYAQAHPLAADVLLVIEVADTSITYDREEKLPRYALSGIPEAWLIDLNQQVVEQYTQPRNGQYRNKLMLERGDTLSAQSVSGLRLSVDDLFV
jgi:Uma2 family endonuclease